MILPERLRRSAAQKAVARPITLGLMEETEANASLPVWRRGDEDPLWSWPGPGRVVTPS